MSDRVWTFSAETKAKMEESYVNEIANIETKERAQFILEKKAWADFEYKLGIALTGPFPIHMDTSNLTTAQIDQAKESLEQHKFLVHTENPTLPRGASKMHIYVSKPK